MTETYTYGGKYAHPDDAIDELHSLYAEGVVSPAEFVEIAQEKNHWVIVLRGN